MSTPRPSRRFVVTGLGFLLAAPAIIGRAAAADFINPYDYGLHNEGEEDQSAAMQAAIDAGVLIGQDLLLPSGQYYVENLRFPSKMRVIGSSRGTYLDSYTGAPVVIASSASDLVFDGITFGGGEQAAIILEECEETLIRNCGFSGRGVAISANLSSATIENCSFVGLADAAIHSTNSNGGLFVRGNRISECGNAGIRIWRDEAGHDGSIITGNSISKIDWKGGGNGQNGNGVNIFQADSVIVSDNVISDCAFTAVRVNAGKNTQVRGNTCLNSGEVAIFSEFGFSGSIIADNIIDGAATGIDITNFDTGGHLATCTGNIVRNIYPSSAVNPDTRPVGIYAEAETVVANNSIEAVPGIGIVAGYGTFLRNVVISNNVLYAVHIGIGVSVVRDPSPGHVSITGNVVSNPRDYGIVGLEWEKIVSDDLARDAASYPHVTIADNTITTI
ncbi:MAG: TIGR03808 family TAT-translocated repetitive protein [Devosia sp.]